MDSGRVEALPAGAVHLDTVRALHQTVVSLRTALELSKNELKELKEKYQRHSNCINYTDVIEKLSVENHILRRKIIESEYKDGESSAGVKLEVKYSPHTLKEDNFTDREVLIKTVTPDLNSHSIEIQDSISATPNTTSELIEIQEQVNVTSNEEIFGDNGVVDKNIEKECCDPDVEVFTSVSSSQSPEEDELCSHISISEPRAKEKTGFKTKLELLSKFDVRIKVRTANESILNSSTTSGTDSSAEEKTNKEETKQEKDSEVDNNIKFKSVSSENIRMAVPNEVDAKSKNDKFDVQVKITSEENLVVSETFGKSKVKDTINLDVDDLSFRSMSEGDNSVFSDSQTPVCADGDKQSEMDNGSENESEEVDDIELIFTTDESKDMSNLQEDLVSIKEAEPWSPSHMSTHSTPVLTKFHTLDPDFQPGENKDNFQNESIENRKYLPDSTLKYKRVSLPSDKDIKHVAFSRKSLDLPGKGILKTCHNKSENMLFRRSPNTSSRRLDSVDSLTCEYNRNLSLDNTKSSSFELGSSMDMLQREGSEDSFYRGSRFGHRFSVFAETDISKCGISEDDLSSNLNIRRNTCPNPFQYRPLQRGISRPVGPFRATLTPAMATRPILRDSAAVRRENGAQTDVSALPNRWSSDGYLAHKFVPLPGPPRATLPAAPPARRPAPPALPALSDLGFTSMVPELSRSADPLWVMGQKQCTCGADGTSYLGSTSRFQSRNSSYRSPCPSVERSYDGLPVYVVPTSASSYYWRKSLPDVRRSDTDELMDEADAFIRRSTENLRSYTDYDDTPCRGRPYVPADPKSLRLGHSVKVITPQGRIAVGKVRYIGLAGVSAADSSVMVGAIFPFKSYPVLPLNDGTYRNKRYFYAPPHHTALFVPFSKVVMAWET